MRLAHASSSWVLLTIVSLVFAALLVAISCVLCALIFSCGGPRMRPVSLPPPSLLRNPHPGRFGCFALTPGLQAACALILILAAPARSLCCLLACMLRLSTTQAALCFLGVSAALTIVPVVDEASSSDVAVRRMLELGAIPLL